MTGELLVDFPQQLRGRRDRQSVTFEEHIEITFIESLIHKHKSDLWWTGREMKSFQHRAAALLNKMKSMNMTLADFAESNLEDTSSWMGLETYMTDNAARMVRSRRKSIVTAVLEEYDRQDGTGIYDPDALARVSAAASDVSRQRARVIALLHDERRGRIYAD